MAVPAVVLSGDARPMDQVEVQSADRVLTACWQAFDRAIETAEGKELRKGPRGGGRELEGIARHVLEAESAYAGPHRAQVQMGRAYAIWPTCARRLQPATKRCSKASLVSPRLGHRRPARVAVHAGPPATSSAALPIMSLITPGRSKTGCNRLSEPQFLSQECL